MWIVVWKSDKGEAFVGSKDKEATFLEAKVGKDWKMRRE